MHHADRPLVVDVGPGFSPASDQNEWIDFSIITGPRFGAGA